MKLWQLFVGLAVISATVISLINKKDQTLNPIPVDVVYPSQFLILPHHDIARPLVSKGISTLTNTPKKIVILSPNHEELGSCNICQYDTLLFKNEQGVNTLMPILKDHFPQASISAYVFKKNTPEDEIDQFITKNSTDGTLFVGSIDFSHYKNKQEADQKDEEIIRYIKDKNIQKIKNLNSDYLDSPPVLITILKLTSIAGLELNLVTRGNSADFVSQATNTTSYLVYSSAVTTELSKSVISEKNNDISIVAVGDIMLGRSVNTNIQKQKDFSFPAHKIYSNIPKSDLFLANLESPFGENCPQTDSGMVFCADPRSVATLNRLGVTVATIANNHIGNQGQTGLTRTIEVLNQNNIKPVSNIETLVIKDKKITIISYNDIPPYTSGINKLSEDSLVKQIKDSRKKSDLIIITPHWGNEYQMASSRQKQLARLAIDTGADLVIGHHPHWVQEVEEYKGKLIYYSLGNFIFDQMWSQKTREGIIAHITIDGSKKITHKEIPIFINKSYQPELIK